ncbi:Membrane steroid-binding protein [Lachnellula suecica]|uniref:Membrane steroid-binding protein n=1 Tax=Lachnellula suecica TaxID=602035 RepID=A0A8T9BU34_9HELO|nr:Membrane steroid-binding protein [Lachnellula suecica]
MTTRLKVNTTSLHLYTSLHQHHLLPRLPPLHSSKIATMASPDPELRQRKPKITSETNGKTISADLLKKEDGHGFPLLDIVRSLVFVLLASSALSYFVTRESFIWGVTRPKWAHVNQIQAYFKGPKQYTDADLAAYDGTNPDLPILLAINGTIYDVSAGRKFYGPGGSYHFFAGADASRAFVTNCFQEDRNPDLRGAELAFLPRDNDEVDSLYTSGELKIQKQKEKKLAKVEVYKALKHWVDFFEKSPKYTKIGMVKREAGWEDKGPIQTLCQKAEDSRPSARQRPEGK